MEKEKDPDQKEVEEGQRVLEPKRVRTHTDTTHDDEDCDKQSSDDWDLVYYRRQNTHIQTHRSVALDPLENVPTPQKGHEFGDTGNDTSCEKQFNLSDHTWEPGGGTHNSTNKTVL